MYLSSFTKINLYTHSKNLIIYLDQSIFSRIWVQKFFFESDTIKFLPLNKYDQRLEGFSQAIGWINRCCSTARRYQVKRRPSWWSHHNRSWLHAVIQLPLPNIKFLPAVMVPLKKMERFSPMSSVLLRRLISNFLSLQV